MANMRSLKSLRSKVRHAEARAADAPKRRRVFRARKVMGAHRRIRVKEAALAAEKAKEGK